MRIEVRRYGIEIIPESILDEAYIEEVLGLKEDGDHVKLVRENAMGLSCLGQLRTKNDK